MPETLSARPASNRSRAFARPCTTPTAQPADFFHLQSTCTDCGGVLYWRLGTGKWDHASNGGS